MSLPSINTIKRGPHWWAELAISRITLYVSPEGDHLPAAIAAVIAVPSLWLCQWLCETDNWDVYLLTLS